MSINGIWHGVLDGTNWGQALLKLSQKGSSVSGVVQVADAEAGTYNLDLKGRVEADEIRIHLAPGKDSLDKYPGTIDAHGKLEGNDQISGEWESSIGTYGTFEIQRRAALNLDPRHIAQRAAHANAAFIMMAFGHAKQGVLPEEDVLAAIHRACKKLSINAYRADEIEHSGDVTALLQSEIKTKRFLISDVTHERPNVYYEVGFAHGLGKEVILVAQSGAEIHFDISGYNVIYYSSASELERKLAKRLETKLTGAEKDNIK